MEASIFRLQAWFSGHVQGVGFRYQALELAKGFAVTGIVQNLPDGRVYLEAEGEAREVQSFLEALQIALKGFIREADVRTSAGERRYAGFQITRPTQPMS